MNDYKKYINALRKCAKEHIDDITPFAYIRVSDLCSNVANLLEELEQEPCEDAISRKAAIDVIDSWLSCGDYNEGERHIMRAMQSVLYDLPSVTPPPKIGHWIFDDECKEHGHCSHCGYGSVDLVDGEPHNFCRNCGARMVEPQEKKRGIRNENTCH